MQRTPKHDKLFFLSLLPFASILIAIFMFLFYFLYEKSIPILSSEGMKFLIGSVWNPEMNEYQIFPMLLGTLETAAIALLISIPLSLAAVAFLNEYVPSGRVAKWITLIFELFAGMPSIIFGIWGAQYLAGALKDSLMVPLHNYFGFIPLFSCSPMSGFTLFTASILLSLMITPYMFSMLNSSYNSIPSHIREAAYSIGLRKYQVFRILLSYMKPGTYASLLLGFGKAAGETVAVSLVIGNINVASYCLFSPGMTISSLIASQFPESYLYPNMLSALYAGGLILLIIGMVFNYLGFVQTKKFRARLNL
ncbi:MAG: phosphate ABC transporter permease subunit PstC [Fervidicoccaceae archaeon]|jgi:phosphate transport system permease protein